MCTFAAVATALGVKVCVTREKKNVLDCLEDAKISSLITLRPREAQVHVLPMAHLKIQVSIYTHIYMIYVIYIVPCRVA